MSYDKVIQLEGSDTPDILLNDKEEVLMDLSQGFRDLGLAGLILRHKGRLIATNQRAIYFKKKTKDYEIEQMNMRHAGYVSMGYNLQSRQFVVGLAVIIGSISLFAQNEAIIAIILLILGLVMIFTARIQGLTLSGSGKNIVFSTKSVPAKELSKIITIVSANS
jgi:hypothetical protein